MSGTYAQSLVLMGFRPKHLGSFKTQGNSMLSRRGCHRGAKPRGRLGQSWRSPSGGKGALILVLAEII